MATIRSGSGEPGILQRTSKSLATTPVKALLLDLDDTLLINDMDVFSSRYFELLVECIQDICPRDRFLAAPMTGTRAMFANDGAQGSNADLFYSEFLPLVGDCADELLPALDAFYAHDFGSLRKWTAVDPDARVLVETAFQHGFQVAIATQPLFPREAVLARLRWAGVSADTFCYDYVACFEEMDACKPQERYFRTICQHLGRQPHECLMVGDSVEADMGAEKHGLRTFWVMRHPPEGRVRVKCNAKGSLRDLINLIESGEIHGI